MDIVLMISCVSVRLGVLKIMKNSVSVYLIILSEIMVVSCDLVNIVVVVVFIIMRESMILYRLILVIFFVVMEKLFFIINVVLMRMINVVKVYSR